MRKCDQCGTLLDEEELYAVSGGDDICTRCYAAIWRTMEKTGTPNPLIRNEFRVHRLNERGMERAEELAEGFSELLNNAESICGSGGREMALVRTHLEQASYYAKRAMASQKENQQ